MSFSEQIVKAAGGVPKIAVGVLLGVLVLGVFVMGFDQGQIFSMAQGEQAYNDMWIHEFSHDMRHSAGFPCH
jgi:uncharacterized membrane protein SpoIIM required for sporulation